MPQIISSIFQGLAQLPEQLGSFFQGAWQGIQNVFSNVGGWFGDRFREAWNNITGIFSNIGNFFGGLWNTISDKFSNIGTNIGNAISGAVKSGINGLLGMIENTVNGFINMINGAIGIINAIPGVNISRINTLNIPKLYRGGVLEKGQVGLLEGNGAEAVVPLERNKGWIKAVANDMKEEMKNNASNINNISNSTSNVNNFTQVINAPKQPSRLELYRQTRNLLNLVNA